MWQSILLIILNNILTFNMSKRFTLLKVIHPGWKEWQNNIPSLKIECPIGKYQYLYFKGKTKLYSLIKLDKNLYPEANWEIYHLKTGNIERFKTKQEAQKHIEKII